MPPIRNKNRKNLDEQEGRILLAISDLQNGRIQRVAQAARIYEIPRTTLQDRLNGIQQRSLVRANSHKLTQYEEESLVKWVLDLDRRGLPPRHSLVREMANYILSQHGKPQVGKNWITKLIKRRPEIDSKFARKYNYERAKCEDPKIIQEHFDRVQAAISEYGILPEDIFNFDETGFAMGLCATAKVITGSDRYAQPKLLQPGNREWVTAIEATNSTGWAVPSYVIFKAKKNVREGWFDDLPDDWRINISDNGWTTDQIGLEWLKTHFIPYINGRTVGKYRMLILDGHGSHLTPEFDHICTENNIIPVCMPPHSSHLLQPLDVGCFAVLKRHYGQLVEQRMRLGFNHIDKMDFLTAFPQARTVAYKAQTIRNSFAATGLVPFNPDRVIQQLNIRLKTPTPPPSRSSNTASSCLQTPQNIRQFIRQSTTINKRINERTESNQNQEINQAVVRLSKAYEMIANDVLLVRKENYDLRAAHEKEKQKRQKSKKQISIEQGVTKEEVQALVQGQVEASHAVTTTPAEPELPASQAVVRRQYRCSELTNALVVLVVRFLYIIFTSAKSFMPCCDWVDGNITAVLSPNLSVDLRYSRFTCPIIVYKGAGLRGLKISDRAEFVLPILLVTSCAKIQRIGVPLRGFVVPYILRFTGIQGYSDSRSTMDKESDTIQGPPKPAIEYVDFEGPDDPLHPFNWPIGKRRLISAILSLSTMFVAGTSSIFSSAIPSIMAIHGISREVGTLGVSLYVLGFALGPMIWASFSELKGRYMPFTISMFGFSVFCFATARSTHDPASIFICRFFAGLFGAGPLTLAGAVFSDMYPPRERNIMMVMFSLTVFIGPMVSQPIGGFIVMNHSLGWVWTEYLPGILGSAALVAVVIFQEETYWPVLLARKADRLRRETGDWSIIAKHDTIILEPKVIVREYLLLPLRMLTSDPIVLFMCIFGAFVYGLLYLFLTAYPAVFQGVHGMTPGVAGLPFLAIIVGQFIFLIIMGLVQKRWLVPRIIANQGQLEPEWMLPIAIPGAASFSAALFWFGWSGYKRSVHWMVPTASGLFSGFGLLAMFVPSISYLILARPQRAASAVAAHTFIRSLFGATFPLFATYMYENLGIEWASTLLGCLAALMIPIPVLLYIYGAKIRQKVQIEY
ncbi:MFS multidrug transporter, putative [Talaromyces stipitatus ATCC 10500]|uniref:MFS multidrug transporter, putative n=1 Tax=Talaromyces stipitatus (strain ATCC 10500 / CBS 375.48 / QM 6759 / NRRL 1006) TaxID=441959 RepID=B8M560_TALSN|nr:MFS multidrug transporter, putative [Talaromyces stipitatus ATCC 10500]EED19666.1 MFS multidrug transporter, putative [Talaromyces stipitatus ATCC 10500]